MTELVLFGPLAPDSALRVDRGVEDALLRLLNRGQYVNLVGGRQKGKTTALLWLRQALANQGSVSAYVDLSPLGEASRNADAWVRLVASAVNDSLMPADLRASSSPVPEGFPELQAYFISVALAAGPKRPVVLMFDEVTAVPAQFRHPFFYGIRALFNLRSDVGRPDGVDGLLFVFSGSFDPDRLIPNTANSPFNVAQTVGISEYDYSLDNVRDTLDTAGSNLEPEAVLRLTGGHPYLTNRVASMADTIDVDNVPEALLSQGDTNLSHIARTLREATVLRDLSCRIVSGENVPFVPGIDPAIADLAILGIIKPDARRRAEVSGDIYRRMLELICASAEDDHVLTLGPTSLLAFVTGAGLKSHLEGLLKFAVGNAASHPALAAVCIGAVVEGALLSVLETRTDLRNLAMQLNDEIHNGRIDNGLRFRDVSRSIEDWSLAQMVEVARLAGIVSRPSSQISHSLREWRNLVHPAAMRNAFPDGIPTDVADAAVASGHVLIREIGESAARNP